MNFEIESCIVLIKEGILPSKQIWLCFCLPIYRDITNLSLHLMWWDMAIWPSTQYHRWSIPYCSEYFSIICLSCSLKYTKRYLFIPKIPHLDLTIESSSDKDMLCLWIYLNLADSSTVTVELLCLFWLSLSQVIKPNHSIFMSTKNIFLIIWEISINCGACLVIGEDTCLYL